jgi:hypothetical protein
MMSNDSVKTLDKALLNANDPSVSSVMDTVPHQLEGSRILDCLYSNTNNGTGGHHPFQANQSDISYQNSDEEEENNEADQVEREAYLSNGSTNFL